MDDSRISLIPGTRDRDSFRIDGVPMAGIHHHPTYTLIYTSRHLTTNINEVRKMFSDPVFLCPEVVINPAYIKNNKDTYFAKVICKRLLIWCLPLTPML